MEGINPNNNSCTTRQVLEKKARPQEQLNCPRCNSTNTKFCYYNNYSLTQPRYFCKTCRRYWTEGGSLRNVPVGGGSRKNKKINNSSSPSPSLAPTSTPASISTATTSSKVIIHQDLINPSKMLQGGGQDLNLAFTMDKYHHHGLPLPFVDNSSSSSSPSSLSALELLRSSMASRGLSPYAPNNPLIPNSSSALYPSSLGFPMQEVVNKANNNNSLGFSMDHQGMGNRSNYDDHHHVQENNKNGGRVLFPFGEVKQQHLSSSGGDHGMENNNKEQGNSSTTGYWNGMIGEGPW